MASEGSCYVVHDEENGVVKIGNNRIERVFRYDPGKGRFYTSQLKDKTTGKNWSVSEALEFRVSVKTGQDTVDIANIHEGPHGGLKFKGHAVEELCDGGKTLKVTIESTRIPVRLHVYQEIHPDCDWTRRWLGVENGGKEPVIVTRYDPEIMGVPSGLRGSYFCSWRWGSKAMVKEALSYVGNGVHSVRISGRSVSPPTVPTDSPLMLTDAEESNFFWFFPEVPIKSVVIREDPRPLLYTLNPWGVSVPPGETVVFSAGIVVGVGAGRRQDGFRSFRSYLDERVVRGNMDYTKALLVYNTWYGLGLDVCESDCMKQIELSAELGLDMYVVDAGWQAHFGDWDVDRSKFPNGLERISEYCHEKGMGFGVWIDGRSACKCSRLYKEHPEWALRTPEGTVYEDEFGGHEIVAMCLAAGYGEHLKNKFVRMAEDLKLDCLKIDHVNLVSFHDYWTECHAADHPHLPGMSHKFNWDWWGEILDAVKAARPGIVIESIPSGLSLLGKHHFVWIADYQYRPDWMKEAYFCRALNYHMAYTHPIAAIHQGWPSTDCTDVRVLDYLCASTIGSNIQCGVTGRIEAATEVQKALLKEWIDWWHANKRYLGVYQHLFEDAPPVPLEEATDDDLSRELVKHWKPSCVDGFAHLLPDGGWIFLFNPTDDVKSVCLTLELSDYGICDFSAATELAGFDYSPKDNTLRLNQVLLPGTYSRSRVQTGYPVRMSKVDTKVLSANWDGESEGFSFFTVGEEGKHEALLATGGLGRPAACENCEVKDYDENTGTLRIVYTLSGGVSAGALGWPILLRWGA